MTKEAFNKAIIEWALKEEQRLNAFGKFRVHIKETKEKAE